MGERVHRQEEMATTSTAVVTTVPAPLAEEVVDAPVPVAVVTLRRRDARKRVVWTDDTVDNEHMNKKKSKCCCIYTKPRAFDESSSESDDEGEHCFGHVERRKRHHHDQHCVMHAGPSAATAQVQEEPSEPTLEVTLSHPAPAPPDKQEPLPSS